MNRSADRGSRSTLKIRGGSNLIDTILTDRETRKKYFGDRPLGRQDCSDARLVLNSPQRIEVFERGATRAKKPSVLLGARTVNSSKVTARL